MLVMSYFSITACGNTFAGLGKDIENLGKEIQGESTDEDKKE